MLPMPADAQLRQLCRSVQARPSQRIHLDVWSKRFGVSEKTLSRRFLRETGLTYRQWVQQVRLACALERLENGEPIGRIAQDLGYVSASAFSAMFRRAIGVSPRDFLVRD